MAEIGRVGWEAVIALTLATPDAWIVKPLALESRKLPCWTNPSRGGTCRRTKEWGGWDASKIGCGGGCCHAFCAAHAGAEPAGCAAGAGSGHDREGRWRESYSHGAGRNGREGRGDGHDQDPKPRQEIP